MNYLQALSIAACALAVSGAARAQPPVPFYSANVTGTRSHNPGSVMIVTKDSTDTVCAWYRKNIVDGNGEQKTSDGAVIFYTKSGATVDVEPGLSFAPGTHIGLVWDAKKFGAYAGK